MDDTSNGISVSVSYEGQLRAACTQMSTGSKVIVDVDKSHGGLGEGYSPPNLLAGSLAACSVSTMGLFAQAHGLDIEGAIVDVKVIIDEEKKKIGEIQMTYNMPDKGYTDRNKTSLERSIRTCPVHKSLHPELKQTVTFNWAK